MKTSLIIVYTSLVLFGLSRADVFDAVTNAWWQGRVSNVVEIAQARLTIDTNDIPALVILTEVDMDTMNFVGYSNHAIRAASLLSQSTNTNLFPIVSEFCADCSNLCDAISSCTLTPAEIAEEMAKSGRPERTMTLEPVLQALSENGLFSPLESSQE